MVSRNFPSLHIGKIDFANPTLLIIGKPEGFEWLAEVFATQKPFDFCSEEKIVKLFNIKLRLCFPTKGTTGLHWIDKKLEWNISPKDAKKFSNQLLQLQKSPIPAHIYLDSSNGTDVLEVRASLNEYPLSIFDEPR